MSKRTVWRWMSGGLVLWGLVLGGVGVAAQGAEPAWHAWGVHGGEITVGAEDVSAYTARDENFHWNKSNWSTRTGQKAYLGTDSLNGRKVGELLSLEYTVLEGYYGNVYFNVFVEDSNGMRAILAPAYNTATDSGWAAPGSAYHVFEAEQGWTGTVKTGWYAATWEEVQGLEIAGGGPLELPDTLEGACAYQGDPCYQFANWVDWAEEGAYDGVTLVFGQSTGVDEAQAETVISFPWLEVAPPPTVVIEGCDTGVEDPEGWLQAEVDGCLSGTSSRRAYLACMVKLTAGLVRGAELAREEAKDILACAWETSR